MPCAQTLGMKLYTRAGLFLLSAVMAYLSGCSREVVDPPDTSLGQEQTSGRITSESPVLLLLVVDDANTPEAAALRGQVVDSVREGLLHVISGRWGSCGSSDPARWHPGDMRIAVARPSAPDDIALLTPVDVPSLAWITQTSLEDEVEVVASAAVSALEERLAQPGDVYRPLHAAKRAADLVSGARSPATDKEAAFIASLPAGEQVWVVVASTRDDEDPAPVDASLLDAKTSQSIYTSYVVGPFTPGMSCEYPEAGSTRLEDWAQKGGASLGTWPCADEQFWDSLLFHWFADCGVECHSRPLVIDKDGAAACRFYVDQPDLAGCDPERGWVDPDGEPQSIDTDGVKVRRCEIVQLTGAKLEACRATLECSGCGSGFCATEVPELDMSAYCKDAYSWPVRFVGGALEPGSYVTGTCQTELPGN
jgi:hypothetical protein